MKNKKSIIIGILIGIVSAVLYIFIEPIIHENNCKSRVFVDMKENENLIKNISSESAVLVIEDKNASPISWDTNYRIQRLSDANVWYDIKSNTVIEMLMKVVTPNDNGITEIMLDWKDIYGKLKKGTYRIVKDKNFTTFYSEPFNIK